MRLATAVAIVMIAASPARADDAEAAADRAFRAAEQRVAAGDPGAIDALEALGRARPATRWTDDAWSEAGRLAERAGDYARARRDDEQAIATATDDQLARRARAALDRIAQATGAGQWDAVAAEHERLTSQMQARGDPTPALRALEALIASHPGYPRGAAALILVARGWARDGDRERAIAAARRAVAIAGPGDRLPAAAELARQLIRAGELDQARTEIAEIDHPAVAADLRAELARAELRDRVRLAAWAMLAAIALVAVIALRRDAGTWRAAARRIARPPIEVVFLAPIALLLAIVASSGNPLVGRAVRAIALAGLAIAWLSGALLEAARARRGALGARRVLVHVALAMLAAGAAAYLAISRDQLFDLVAETLRTGPVR